MASGSSGAKELSKEKHKWSDNFKVYTRRNRRNPEYNNLNSTTVGSNDKNHGEITDKIAVKINDGDENRTNRNENSVKDVPLTTDNNVEKSHGKLVEEVPRDEDVVEEAPRNEDVVEDVDRNENVVEEVSGNVSVIEEVPRNESIVDAVPKNEYVVDEVPGNENVVDEVRMNENASEEAPKNENFAEEVPSNENVAVEVPSNENVVEEVPSNENVIEASPNDESSNKEVQTTADGNTEKDHENIIEEAPDNLNSIKEGTEEVPEDGKTTEEVFDGVTNTEQVTDNDNNIDVRTRENDVEEEPDNEKNVEKAPDNENAVEEGPDNDVNIDEEEEENEVPQKSFSPKLPPVEEANSSQPQHIPSRRELVTLSDDSMSHNRVEAPLPNGHDRDENVADVAMRDERPMVTQIDDRLNISVTAAKSKAEVRDLKRKLEDELGQVRKMARKLEVKETQLNNVGFDSGRSHEAPFLGKLHFHLNGGMDNGVSSMRGPQELGSGSYGTPRPFSRLAVAVMDNSRHTVTENVHEKEKRTPKANKYYRNSEFLLGKEKLPPAEISRKTKSSGGSRKHVGGEFESGYGFDKKIFKKCNDLLQKLRNHKHGWVFNQPVDVKRLGLHDYFDIIKHPMDLGTVKTRFTNNWYKTPREFAEDVRLTFHNAMTYNPEGQDVHIMAKELLRIFEEKWPAIEADYDRKMRYGVYRDLGTPTPTSRKFYAPAHAPIHMPLPPPPLLHPPPSFHDMRNLERSQSMPVRPDSRPKSRPSVGRTPAPKKPKAKDPHKRDMTFDEKQKLSTNLQSLPSEKLDAIAQIIKKRNSAFSQHGDEIEVDIDSVDAETLWELDRFVTNYKKSLSKYKRKAELAMQARARAAAAAQAAQEAAPPAPAVVEAPREDRTGNVAASSHVQQERQSGNASNSSSSSSSSSDSGSSSSDSDSDSSSDSESDEDR
ncbi:hypothetical protein RND81_12G216700 [Saponaria officinalis]|uniref:Transcription factor GTE4 n=1 Tax=Saponaria officinalis TaxID=3572 RepID=A0AAW1HDQ7_SAPOF